MNIKKKVKRSGREFRYRKKVFYLGSANAMVMFFGILFFISFLLVFFSVQVYNGLGSSYDLLTGPDEDSVYVEPLGGIATNGGCVYHDSTLTYTLSPKTIVVFGGTPWDISLNEIFSDGSVSLRIRKSANAFVYSDVVLSLGETKHSGGFTLTNVDAVYSENVADRWAVLHVVINCEYCGDGVNECIPFKFVCGDSVWDYGEQCDDGNLIDDDGCSYECIIEQEEVENLCGNFEVDFGEMCDDGNPYDGDVCSSTCTCFDSDGGSITKIGNVALSSGMTYRDYCIDSRTLNEYSCFKHDVASKVVICSGSCSNGVCVSSGGSPAPVAPSATNPSTGAGAIQ